MEQTKLHDIDLNTSRFSFVPLCLPAESFEQATLQGNTFYSFVHAALCTCVTDLC